MNHIQTSQENITGSDVELLAENNDGQEVGSQFAPDGTKSVGRIRRFPYSREGLTEFISFAIDRYSDCFKGKAFPLWGSSVARETSEAVSAWPAMVFEAFNQILCVMSAACGVPVSFAIGVAKHGTPAHGVGGAFVRAAVVTTLRRCVRVHFWSKMNPAWRGRPKEMIDWTIVPWSVDVASGDHAIKNSGPLPFQMIGKLLFIDESTVRKISQRWGVDQLRIMFPAE
ncbi:MAG: hypothetical protein KIPDCIKN_04351 [Haliscomenobacter sp.]|nr:hypothetical protein [Haliscomenobacter sp.]